MNGYRPMMKSYKHPAPTDRGGMGAESNIVKRRSAFEKRGLECGDSHNSNVFHFISQPCRSPLHNTAHRDFTEGCLACTGLTHWPEASTEGKGGTCSLWTTVSRTSTRILQHQGIVDFQIDGCLCLRERERERERELSVSFLV